jgi:large subunit ribosomal protein L23
LLTEKATKAAEKRRQYAFVVDKQANKIEIKKAVQDAFQVTVEGVNTLVMPAKRKSRNTRAGVIRGRVSSYKKALVTLSEGETISLFGASSGEEE